MTSHTKNDCEFNYGLDEKPGLFASLPFSHLLDRFWLVDYNGKPLDSKIKTVGYLRLF